MPANCEYIDMPGNYLPFTDTYLANVADIEACRDECNRQDRYNCRSFNYNSDRKECFLSSDDSISLPTQLQQDPSFVFSEKSGCNNGKWKPETANRDKHRGVKKAPLIHPELNRKFNF